MFLFDDILIPYDKLRASPFILIFFILKLSIVGFNLIDNYLNLIISLNFFKKIISNAYDFSNMIYL